jgi:hypothetical protein
MRGGILIPSNDLKYKNGLLVGMAMIQVAKPFGDDP